MYIYIYVYKSRYIYTYIYIYIINNMNQSKIDGHTQVSLKLGDPRKSTGFLLSSLNVAAWGVCPIFGHHQIHYSCVKSMVFPILLNPW